MSTNTGFASLRSSRYPMVIVGILFFILGFITWLNSVLIPYLRIACELTNFQSYFVAFAFYIACFLMAIPSGWIVRRLGYKRAMSTAILVIAAGASIFIPAALTRQYFLFLFGLFVQGCGLALLQTAANPYIVVLGPPQSAAKRISVMGIANKVAGAIAPIVLGAIALNDVDSINDRLNQMLPPDRQTTLNVLASKVISPYVAITLSLIALALLVRFSRLPELSQNDQTSNKESQSRSIWEYPQLILGVVTLFLYVGAEVIAGDSIIAYAASQGISLSIAKYFTTITLGTMIIGYLIGIVMIPRILSQEKALKYSGTLGLILTGVVLVTEGLSSVIAVAMLGLANALVWPAIWPLALAGLGNLTKTASSYLIMGISGGAIIPLLYGQIADSSSQQLAYIILFPCYLAILFFSVSATRLKSN